MLGGQARVTGNVLLYDEIGDQPAGVCADVMARAGCEVTLVTPDRATLHDLGPTNAAVVMRDLAAQNVRFECFEELVKVEANDNRLQATMRHVLTGAVENFDTDHVVVENGTTPVDDIYFALKSHASNNGQLDHQAMIEGRWPFGEINRDGKFVLARIGDAVAGRNIHAAIYDAMRVCVNL